MKSNSTYTFLVTTTSVDGILNSVDCALTTLEANVTTQRALNTHRVAVDLSMLYVAPYRLQKGRCQWLICSAPPKPGQMGHVISNASSCDSASRIVPLIQHRIFSFV